MAFSSPAIALQPRLVPGRCPRRQEIAAATVAVLHRGPWFKADLLIVDLGQGPLVVKDFAAKPWLTRQLGRVQISNEHRAYCWLGPLPCVPALIGRIDDHALAIERIGGELITDAADRFRARRRHLTAIRRVIDQLQHRGFAHLDLRARRNILLRPDGEVVVIDLAGSLWWRPGAFGYGLFERCLRWWYKATLLKWKKLLTPGRAPREGRTFRYHRGLIDLMRAWRWRS